MRRNGNNIHNRQRYAAARKLYGDRAEEFLRRYAQKKRILIILSIVFSIAGAASTVIMQSNNPQLIRGYFIAREEKEGRTKDVRIEAISANGYSKTLQIRVPQQAYSEDELTGMWPSFSDALRNAIYADGESADYVTKDLTLPSGLPSYPFVLKWRSDQPLILSGDGRIHEDKVEETEEKQQGIPVILKAEASCQDFREELMIPVRVYSRYRTKEEVFWQQAEKTIEAWSERSAGDAYQQLPDTVAQENMEYKEQRDERWILLLLFGVIIAFLSVKRMDDTLIRRVRERDEQLEAEYPQLVNRFVLYYGAGLTIKNIWKRICRDYEERKKQTGINAAYEEMLKADRKMQDGVGEAEAYTSFASAISLTRYRNLTGLLLQTLQTGGSDIKEQLNEQLRGAFAEQKRTARIRGEKAGTKMLMPMFLMLLIVLVVILVPAFLTF